MEAFSDIKNKQTDRLTVNDIVLGRQMLFLAESQLWYNVWGRLSAGTEIEISNNFLPGQKEVKVNPTLALKWNF